ncbi:MAG: NADH-quinone oxidoreductase subunit A [Candidatus Lernaella stagnicola]|nr:NADH-quinone oxidoreductase subunit A [Candidatus Lernaella stagnicola]
MPIDFLPLFFYLLLVIAIGALGIVGLSRIVGPRKDTSEKLSPYECGVPPVGDPHEKFPMKYYVIGMLFILFDVEIIFFYPWAVIFKDMNETSGLFGLIELAVFTFVLLVGFIYVWRKGALEWE